MISINPLGPLNLAVFTGLVGLSCLFVRSNRFHDLRMGYRDERSWWSRMWQGALTCLISASLLFGVYMLAVSVYVLLAA